MINPILEDPVVKARLTDSQSYVRIMTLMRWAEQSFSAGKLHDSMSLDQAMEVAQFIDYPMLFEQGIDDESL